MISRNEHQRGLPLYLLGLLLLSSTSCALSTDRPVLASAELSGVKFRSGHPNVGESFEHAAMEPAADQVKRLQTDVNAFKEAPMLHAEVLGFTDNAECLGAECDELSLRRAQVVYEWLVAHGVPRANLKAPKGHGSAMPIGSNETEEGRSLNRRVEVNIIPSSYPDY